MKRSISLIIVVSLCAVSAPALAQYEPPPPPNTTYVPPPPGYVPPPPGYAQPPPGYPQPPAAPDPESGFRFKVAVGPTYRSLYGISFLGADIQLALGGQTRRLAFYGGLDTFLGGTTFGLTTSRLVLSFTIEGVIADRWRLGGGPRYGVLVIRRITNGSAIVDGSLGLGFYVSVDLVRWGPRALFLQMKMGADMFFVFSNNNTGVPVMLDIGAALGFRL